MNVELTFEQLFSPAVLVFCIGIYVFSLGIRRGLEAARPSLITNKTWNDVILPSIPVLFGAVLAIFAYKYIWAVPIKSKAWRFFLGGTYGFFSSYLYRIAKSILIKKGGAEAPQSAPEKP